VPAAQRTALIVGALSVVWLLVVMTVGGIDTTVLGVRVRADRWSDPAIVAVVSLVLFVRLRGRMRSNAVPALRPALVAAWRRWRTPDGLLLTALLVVAAVARVWGLTFGLPHPAARPDEDAVGALAGGFYSGDFRPAIFDYPPLFMLAVAAALWLIFDALPPLLGRMNIHPGIPGISMPAERIVARLLSAVAGVTGVWLLFRIGVRLFGRSTALVAAALLSLAFLHVRDSHFGVTDVAMTCMELVGFLAIVRLAQTGSRRDCVTAAVAIGLAIATKYNAALLMLPASFAILDDPLKRPLTTRVGRVIVLAAVAAVTFLIVCPYALLDRERFLADAAGVSRHLIGGHVVDLGRGWTYHITTTLRYGLGAPLLAAAIVGLPLMLWREGRRGVLVALFPLAYYGVMGSGRTVFARYALPLVPFMCLTAAYAIATGAACVTRSLGRPRWQVACTAALSAAVLWPSVRSDIAFDRLLAREDSRVIARRWIETRFAPGDTIAEIGPVNGRVYVDYEQQYGSPRPLEARPTLVVVVSSPATRSPDVEVVPPWLAQQYDLRFVETVADEDDAMNTYDRQDEFFLPIGGFHHIERPGPNIRIFVRRGDLAVAVSGCQRFSRFVVLTGPMPMMRTTAGSSFAPS
jgi:hypothetical protein